MIISVESFIIFIVQYFVRSFSLKCIQVGEKCIFVSAGQSNKTYDETVVDGCKYRFDGVAISWDVIETATRLQHLRNKSFWIGAQLKEHSSQWFWSDNSTLDLANPPIKNVEIVDADNLVENGKRPLCIVVTGTQNEVKAKWEIKLCHARMSEVDRIACEHPYRTKCHYFNYSSLCTFNTDTKLCNKKVTMFMVQIDGNIEDSIGKCPKGQEAVALGDSIDLDASSVNCNCEECSTDWSQWSECTCGSSAERNREKLIDDAGYCKTEADQQKKECECTGLSAGTIAGIVVMVVLVVVVVVVVLVVVIVWQNHKREHHELKKEQMSDNDDDEAPKDTKVAEDVNKTKGTGAKSGAKSGGT